MNSENSTLKKFTHSIGQNWYHLVFIPKYRYPVFAQYNQRMLMGEAIDFVCKTNSIELFTKEVMDDHVHLFVSCPPYFSLRKLAQILKGGTSYYLRSKLIALRRYKSLWGKGFMYRSVGAVSAEVVRRYIDNSNHWFDTKQKKLIN
jgi:putative transposase